MKHTADAEQTSISRLIHRKPDGIELGVFATVDGKRVGTSVVVPRTIEREEIDKILDYGEQSLRDQITRFMAQRLLSKKS